MSMLISPMFGISLSQKESNDLALKSVIFILFDLKIVIGDLAVPKEAKDIDIGAELGEEVVIEDVPEEPEEIDEETKNEKGKNGY